MAKVAKDIAGALFPTPVTLVTTVGADGRPNIITLAWVGVVCSNPFMISISVRPPRFSHGLLAETPEFVVNLPGEDQLEPADLCGTTSGRDTDKFALAAFTPLPATKVKAPLLAECPVNLECRVRNVQRLGTHDVFTGEVLAVHVDDSVLDDRGNLDYAKIRPLVYLDNDYWNLSEIVGHYAFTRRK